MDGISERHEPIRIYFNRRKVWLVTVIIAALGILSSWADSQDGVVEPQGQFFVLVVICLAIYGPLEVALDRRPVVLLDDSGVSLEHFGWRMHSVPFSRKSMHWDEIGEVRTCWFGAYHGIVLIPKGDRYESGISWGIRLAGLWPRPMAFNASLLEIGAPALAQLIQDRRSQPPKTDTMEPNARPN